MKKKKGSVLILTLVVVTLLMVLATSLFSVSVSTYKTKVVSDNINKLNIMSESGVEAALSQVKKAVSSSSLVDIMGLKSEDGTIICDVKFYKGLTYNTSTKSYIVALGTDTIESKASNITSSSSRTIRVAVTDGSVTPVTPVTPGVPGTTSGMIPTDNLFFINGAVANGNFNCAVANGAVYVNGNFYMSSGSSIKGKLIATGNITLTGGSSSTNGIVSFGNVNLDGGGIINGDSLAKGDLSFGGGTKINGNVQSDGNLIMPQGNIQNSATIGGSATFSGGAPKIGGKLYYKETATSAWGTVADFVPSGAIKTTTYTHIDLSSYACPTLPVIAVPTITENPQLYSNVILNNNKISNSGSLSSSLFNSVNYGATITIDTSSNDVSLLVNNFTFDPENGLDFEVTGPHNLYIYLKGASDFKVGSNQFIGMKNHNATSQIYIIGDGNQNVALNNCELDGYIYVPSGSFSASGGAPSTYMFQGSCITKSVNIQSNISVNYVKPNITGTPLAVLGGGASWSLDKWYN